MACGYNDVNEEIIEFFFSWGFLEIEEMVRKELTFIVLYFLYLIFVSYKSL